MSTPIAWDDPFRVNATTLRRQFDPDVAGLTNDTFISVWTDNSKTGADLSGSAVRAQIFNAFGDKVSAEFLVNTSTKAAQTAPCVAALANGRTVVLWQDAVDPIGQATGFIRGQIFNADGSKSGQEFVVSRSLRYADKVTQDPQSITYSLGNVVALPNGGFAVLSFRRWLSSLDFEISTRTAVIKFYSANGDEVASVSSLMTSHLFETGSAEMTVLQNGRVVLVSHTIDDLFEEHASLRIYSANGTPLLNANITPADTGVSRSLIQVCPLAIGGRFIVIWTEDDAAPGRVMVGQLFSSAGGKVGSEFQIADLPNDPQGIQAAALPDGRIVIIWLDDGNVMGQLHNADGSMSGDQFTIHGLGLAGSATVSVLADGRFVVSWDQTNLAHLDSEVFAQIYDPRLAGIHLNGTAQNDSLVGSAFDDTIQGSLGHDSIVGGSGNDYLDGGDGNDRLYGLDGNDFILGDDGNDLLRGLGGDDVLAGHSGNDTMEGGAGNDYLDGLHGNDGLNGGAGNDTMRGSYGDDNYVVQSDGDVVLEFANQGVDTVRSSVDYTLGQYVENLKLLGTDNLVALGNSRNNIITGNDGDNDIVGAIGADILIGGKGRDDFIYTALADSGKGLARDVIKDFAEDIDRIDLSLMDAVTSTVPDDAFVWIGGAAFSGVAGQLRVTKIDLAGSASDKTIVAGDVDGNKIADFQIELSGLHKLDAGDFVL